MAATGAERGLAAAVVQNLKSDAIRLDGLGVMGVVDMITCLLLRMLRSRR